MNYITPWWKRLFNIEAENLARVKQWEHECEEARKSNKPAPAPPNELIRKGG